MPIRLATVEIFTIDPPPALINSGIAARVIRNTPVKLMSNTFAQVASSVS